MAFPFLSLVIFSHVLQLHNSIVRLVLVNDDIQICLQMQWHHPQQMKQSKANNEYVCFDMIRMWFKVDLKFMGVKRVQR